MRAVQVTPVEDSNYSFIWRRQKINGEFSGLTSVTEVHGFIHSAVGAHIMQLYKSMYGVSVCILCAGTAFSSNDLLICLFAVLLLIY